MYILCLIIVGVIAISSIPPFTSPSSLPPPFHPSPSPSPLSSAPAPPSTLLCSHPSSLSSCLSRLSLILSPLPLPPSSPHLPTPTSRQPSPSPSGKFCQNYDRLALRDVSETRRARSSSINRYTLNSGIGSNLVQKEIAFLKTSINSMTLKRIISQNARPTEI